MNLLGRGSGSWMGANPRMQMENMGTGFLSQIMIMQNYLKSLSSKWFLDTSDEEQSLALAPVICRGYDLN